MRQEGGSQSFRITRSDASSGDLGNSTESRTLLSRDYTEFRPAKDEKEPLSRALAREIAEHKRHVEAQSHLDRGLSFLGNGFSGSSQSLKNLEALEAEALKGEPTEERKKEMLKAISDDQSAMSTDSEITKYGSAMLQTAGLFLRGKKGIALTVAAFAASSAKPEDSKGTQVVDMTLGVSKGLLTRAAFGAIGRSTAIDIPTKALAMGGTSRLTESVLNRQTYLNPEDGAVNLLAAPGRILGNTLKPEAVVTDLLVFGGGQLAISSSAVRKFAEKSPLSATVAAASAFGFAGGGAEEASRQIATGEFDITKIVGRGIARGATDAIASVPGGLQGNRAAALKTTRQGFDFSQKTEGLMTLQTEPTKIVNALADRNGSSSDISNASRTSAARNSSSTDRAPVGQNGDRAQHVQSGDAVPVSARSVSFGRFEVIHPTIPGSKSREFQLVGGDARNLDMLRGSKSASAVVAVRELSPSGEVIGPTKQMLVQHVDGSNPINSRLAATVDLIASCNPQLLLAEMKSKHIFPDVNGSVSLTRLSDRLTFGSGQFNAATAGGAIKLGQMTVSDLLMLPTTKDMLRTPRPVELYAREMKHFRDPAKRVIDAGADSIVFELADGRILKMTDRPYRKDGQPVWQPDWGHRTIVTPEGVPYRFDARLLTDPKQIEVNHEPVMYYIQERARTPVSTKSLLRFHDQIDRDGNYVFWDGGVSSLGQAQLGYVKGTDGQRRLVLLDYDAVRKPGDVPQDAQNSPGSDNHWMSRYRADRVDWDKVYR